MAVFQGLADAMADLFFVCTTEKIHVDATKHRDAVWCVRILLAVIVLAVYAPILALDVPFWTNLGGRWAVESDPVKAADMLLEHIEKKLKRVVSIEIFSLSQWNKLKERKDPFYNNVMMNNILMYGGELI